MPLPTATYNVPFVCTERPSFVKILLEESITGVQLFPSVEWAIVQFPLPTATHLFVVLLQVIPLDSVKIFVEFVAGVQLNPSLEKAIEFVPFPVATNIVPFHAMLYPVSVKIALPNPVQLIPSLE